MPFEYSKLRGKIVEKFGSIENFSIAMKITSTTMGLKLSNRSMWKQDEIIIACSLLEISKDSIPDYFFCRKTLEI